jgi:hypothetical protein
MREIEIEIKEVTKDHNNNHDTLRRRVSYNCQKPGHILKYCQNKKHETNGGEECYSFLTLYDQARAPRGKFIVNSGTSSHVCI